ncbi:MAG: ABC transporter permease [Candidatus Saelkia tenebricola]|nr:ABC transporter permease [Candidatus Saelkia tenebricola]
MRFEFWLAKKYLSRKEAKFLKLISVITVLGVAIGVMTLLVVIAVMNGFDKELEEKILGINSDLLIKSEPVLYNYEEVVTKLDSLDEIMFFSPVVVGNGSLVKNGFLENIYIKGIDLKQEVKTTNLEKYLIHKLDNINSNGIVIGKVMAEKFDLILGSTVEVLMPFQFESFPFVVEGIFESGMYEYDASLVYINLNSAKDIFSISGVTSLEIKIKNPYKADVLKKEIQDILGVPFYVLSWIDMNKNLFQALKLEKTAMFIILCLIVLVASFNIASVLIMSVLGKIKDIGIMRAIGARAKDIRRVFIIQGMLIGFTGILLGTALGGALIYIIDNYKIIKLPSDIYYIDALPVAPSMIDFVLIVSSALLITFISTLYPAIKAAKFDPVVALRYE